jgi:hypothetical protein
MLETGEMKLLMIIVESVHKEELEVLLNKHDIVGYTEIPQVHGSGTTGQRMGSGAFPKTSSLIFTVIPADFLKPLVDDIERYCEACMKHMKMIVWSVEQVI